MTFLCAIAKFRGSPVRFCSEYPAYVFFAEISKVPCNSPSAYFQWKTTLFILLRGREVSVPSLGGILKAPLKDNMQGK